jgi:hypothetical protein
MCKNGQRLDGPDLESIPLVEAAECLGVDLPDKVELVKFSFDLKSAANTCINGPQLILYYLQTGNPKGITGKYFCHLAEPQHFEATIGSSQPDDPGALGIKVTPGDWFASFRVTDMVFLPYPDQFFDDMCTYEQYRWDKADGWGNSGIFNCAWRADHITHNSADCIMEIRLDDQPCPGGCSGYPYASGEYRTDGFHGYGCYEARFKAPPNSGVVTSFFTYAKSPYDVPPGYAADHNEIDIEILGKDTTKVQTNFYTNGDVGHEAIYSLGFDAAQGFHTYGFKWTSQGIWWYADGAELRHVANSPSNPTPNENDTPHRVMLNMWPVTSAGAPWAGPFVYPGQPIHGHFDWVKFTPGEDCAVSLINWLPMIHAR